LVATHVGAVGHSKLDDIGQVVLALAVVIVQPRQPARSRAVGTAMMPL
jgi:hypothetical protein